MQNRVKKLQSSLKPGLGFIIEDLNDLYYLTGLSVSAGIMLVTKDRAFFSVDSRYFESVRKKSPCPVLLSKGGPLDPFLSEVKLKEIAFDPSETTCQRASLFKKNASKIPVVEIPSPVKKLRLIKDKREIDELRLAAKLNQEGMDFAIGLLQEGIEERQIALELEIFWKRKGGKALSFDPIIAFGENAACPHHHVTDRKLMKGDIVLLDMGISLSKYQSDMTRTLFFGNSSSFWEKAYNAVLASQKKALKAIKPGVLASDLDKSARSYLKKVGLADYFTHSLGHGVGIEIHEAPWIRNRKGEKSAVLEPGMVITVEPGIYFPGKGGIRIEDTVLVTSSGYENFYPREKPFIALKR